MLLAPDLRHFVLDYTDVDADCTWVITEGDHAIGRISHYQRESIYRITFIAPGVPAPKFVRHVSLNAAKRHLHEVREAAPALQIRPSGLTGLQEDVLLAETDVLESGAIRDARADALGISPTAYLQILLGLIDNPKARAFRPIVIAKVTNEREHKLARRPGRQRSARPAA
jgi:hypothetical protein